MVRVGKIGRNTKETQISLSWDLDGEGSYKGTCGVGFFDHMMHALCVHGGFDIDLTMKGDLEVDCHHSIEDLGIVLGMALKEALQDKGGIRRYGSFYIPMDEALGFCALDVSGRAFLVFDADFENHHKIEAIFKAFAHALREAVTETDKGVLSSKGVL